MLIAIRGAARPKLRRRSFLLELYRESKRASVEVYAHKPRRAIWASRGQIEELDVLIVGAGFSGLYQLQQLRRLGFSVKIYEAAPELGGVWYWNCYPGARCDTRGPLYQFSSETLWRDWDFDELYPSWEQLRALQMTPQSRAISLS